LEKQKTFQKIMKKECVKKDPKFGAQSLTHFIKTPLPKIGAQRLTHFIKTPLSYYLRVQYSMRRKV
jgi:hypothetical protein